MKMRNQYQLAIQRDRFPNKFLQSLPWMSFRESCHVLMLSMSDITILSISIYASSALENYGGLPFGSRSSGLRVILIPELWGSNHDHHKLMGSKVATATLWSLNAGDQNILIPLLRPSHHFDPRICKDQTIKSMIQIDRVLMIAQPWVSKQDTPQKITINDFSYVVQSHEVVVLEYHNVEYLCMLWAGIGFSCYASSHLLYFRGRPFSSLHAWLRARAGALATKNIELLSYLNTAVGFSIQFPHNWNQSSVATDNQNEQSVFWNSKGSVSKYVPPTFAVNEVFRVMHCHDV
jgi:hypothetical protein